MSTNLTRRAALAGTAAAALTAGASLPAIGADHPDAALLALWEDYKAAVIEREPYREAACTVEYCDPRAAEIEAADDEMWQRCNDIANTIAETDAATPDGLLVKLAAIKAAAGPRIDSEEDWEVDQDAMASLIRSVEAIGGQFHV